MINPNIYLENLNKAGIHFYSGVPDSLLKQFCACISENINDENHTISSNEGAAIALGIGNYIGTGSVPFIYLQNSGLGNIINPILSLASQEVYGIPMIIMIGWRGAPNVKDEPQHVHQGRVMKKSMDAMDIPHVTLSKDEDTAIKQTNDAITKAKKYNTPVFLIVEKNTFSKYAYEKPLSKLDISREQAIITASKLLESDAVVVSTTGMPSRELFEFRANNNQGHHRDFLTVGGMGHANQIALGISKAQPSRPIYCFDGDGAAIMHMGSIAVLGQSNAKNLIHIIFNNGVHDSVGGQPTVGFKINFSEIANACGYLSSATVISEAQFKAALQKAQSMPGPHLIDVHVRPGNRSDIGRPTSSPNDNKNAIMRYLGTL